MIRGNLITRQAVWNEVLAIIDLLVENMTRHPSAEYHDPEARLSLSDWLDHTAFLGDVHAGQGGSCFGRP